jgi:hypothetical protein
MRKDKTLGMQLIFYPKKVDGTLESMFNKCFFNNSAFRQRLKFDLITKMIGKIEIY